MNKQQHTSTVLGYRTNTKTHYTVTSLIFTLLLDFHIDVVRYLTCDNARLAAACSCNLQYKQSLVSSTRQIRQKLNISHIPLLLYFL